METRQNRGTVEKYYCSVALQFAVDHRLLSISPQASEASGELHAMLISILEATLEEVRERFDVEESASGAPCVSALMGNPHIRTSPEKAARLSQQLQQWLQAFQAAHDDEGEVEYSLMLAFYPLKPID